MLLIVLIRLKRILHVHQTLKSLSHSVLRLKAKAGQDVYLVYVTESIKKLFFLYLLRSEDRNRFIIKGVTSWVNSFCFKYKIFIPAFVTWVYFSFNFQKLFNFDFSQIRLRYSSNLTAREFKKVHLQGLNQHYYLIRYLYNLSMLNNFVDKSVSDDNNTTKTYLLAPNQQWITINLNFISWIQDTLWYINLIPKIEKRKMPFFVMFLFGQ